MLAVTATPTPGVVPVVRVAVGEMVKVAPEVWGVLEVLSTAVRPAWNWCVVSAEPTLLVARTVYVYEPATVGVPESTPADESVIVPGRSLLTKEYVTAPPDATKVYVNAWLSVAKGDGELEVNAGWPCTATVGVDDADAVPRPLSAVSTYRIW